MSIIRYILLVPFVIMLGVGALFGLYAGVDIGFHSISKYTHSDDIRETLSAVFWCLFMSAIFTSIDILLIRLLIR